MAMASWVAEGALAWWLIDVRHRAAPWGAAFVTLAIFGSALGMFGFHDSTWGAGEWLVTLALWLTSAVLLGRLVRRAPPDDRQPSAALQVWRGLEGRSELRRGGGGSPDLDRNFELMRRL
jgi:hypothetical protein